MSCVPGPNTNQFPCCVASLTRSIGNFTSASLYWIDTLPLLADHEERVEEHVEAVAFPDGSRRLSYRRLAQHGLRAKNVRRCRV